MTQPPPEHPQDEPAMPQPPYGQQPPYSAPPAPPGQAPAYGYPPQAPVSPSDARMWSMIAHLGGNFLSFLVPLGIYLSFKDRDPFIRRHSAQALNFHITLAIVYVVSVPLIFFLGLGFLTMLAAWVCGIVFSILAAVAANEGRPYTYPLVPQMIT